MAVPMKQPARAVWLRIRGTLAQSHPPRRALLLGMVSVLLLSGCMLSPLFQAPAMVLASIATLLGMAACGAGGGGGGGGSDTPPTWPAVVSVTLLNDNPTKGVIIGSTSAQYDGIGWSVAIGPRWQGDGFDTLVTGAPHVNVSLYGEGTDNARGRAFVV